MGFEFHQQLDTEEKLFCGCPPELREVEDADHSLVRRLHPTESELGEVDRAALEEARRKRVFRYLGFTNSTCLVEEDEEPPRRLNREALDLARQVALLLGSEPVDRVEVMRKIVIDGSNTAGFQRTALVALGGEVDTSEGPVRVETVALEEEAAQRQGREDGFTVFSLDRLGIPLIEVGCAPDIESPGQAREFAERVGTIFRSTGRVKRGIGTIRQDVNISVEGGARVELKGVQELGLVEDYVEREAARQRALLDIRDELDERGVSGSVLEPVDVSGIFERTGSQVIRDALESGGGVYAGVLRGFEGLLGKEVQPGRRFGTELSDRAKTAGVGGILHTDEMPGNGVTREEVESLRDAVSASRRDVVVLVADERDAAMDALDRVGERVREALRGVPGETRRPLPDGNSQYMRPLPGAARMYPETDVPPVEVSRERVGRMRGELPELVPDTVTRFVEEYGLNEEMAKQVARSGYRDLFEAAVTATGVDPVLAVRTILHYPRELGVEVDEGRLFEVMDAVSGGEVAKEAVPGILEELGRGDRAVAEIVEDLGLQGLEEEELREVIREVLRDRRGFVEENGMDAVGPLMGPVMGRVRGSVDGAEVNRVLVDEIKRLLED